MDALQHRIRRHAPQLTDYELETAARACWVLAHRASEDAAKIADPRMG